MVEGKMKEAAQLLGVDLYEIFAIKGTPGRSVYRRDGKEFKYFFTEYSLNQIVFPKHWHKIVELGDWRGWAPEAPDIFHDLFAGMVTLVRAKPDERKYIRYHELEQTTPESLQDPDELSISLF